MFDGDSETGSSKFRVAASSLFLTPVIKHREQKSNDTVQNVDRRGRDNANNAPNLQVGDKFDLRGSQGAIVNPKAGTQVTQQFGNTTNINTEGGDYAGGNLSK